MYNLHLQNYSILITRLMPINIIHHNQIMLTDILWCLMRENQKVRKYVLHSDVVITWDIDKEGG